MGWGKGDWGKQNWRAGVEHLLLTCVAWKNKHKDRSSSLINVLCWKLCFITNPIENLKIFFGSVFVAN